MELASFPQWDQTNAPDVQEKNQRVMADMTLVVVDIAINPYFSNLAERFFNLISNN